MRGWTNAESEQMTDESPLRLITVEFAGIILAEYNEVVSIVIHAPLVVALDISAFDILSRTREAVKLRCDAEK